VLAMRGTELALAMDLVVSDDLIFSLQNGDHLAEEQKSPCGLPVAVLRDSRVDLR
jgi:hypothetical protein